MSRFSKSILRSRNRVRSLLNKFKKSSKNCRNIFRINNRKSRICRINRNNRIYISNSLIRSCSK